MHVHVCTYSCMYMYNGARCTLYLNISADSRRGVSVAKYIHLAVFEGLFKGKFRLSVKALLAQSSSLPPHEISPVLFFFLFLFLSFPPSVSFPCSQVAQ